MVEDTTVRVKSTYLTSDGPKIEVDDVKGHQLLGVIVTVYKGDNYKGGPPFETRFVGGKSPPVQVWTWEEADAAHNLAVDYAVELRKAH